MAGSAVDGVTNTAKKFMPSMSTVFKWASYGAMAFGIGNVLAAGHAAVALTAPAGAKIGALDAITEGIHYFVAPDPAVKLGGIKEAMEPLSTSWHWFTDAMTKISGTPVAGALPACPLPAGP